MMDFMKMRVMTIAIFMAFSILAGRAIAATPPGAGHATGDLVVNGKRMTLSYAVAVTGPDTFDPTKEAVMVLLTDKPVPQSKIDSATSFCGGSADVDLNEPRVRVRRAKKPAVQHAREGEVVGEQRCPRRWAAYELAVAGGFEPPTYGLTIRRSTS
jgi:hypothetical protein